MRWMVLTAALAVGGCDRAVQLCDDEIKAQLKAPSTYKRISADKSQTYGGTIVTVEYEAQNSFGVPLREKHSCSIPS